ncbi:MAG: L,D-transpeptidase family protein [Pseudomonadota bacterium]
MTPRGAEARRAGADDLVVGRFGARFGGRWFVASVGHGGIVPAETKREGDGATPAGAWRLTRLYWRPDRLARPHTVVSAVPLGPRTGWAEDPCDPAYNSEIRHPHGFAADRMRRGDGLYDLCAATDHNAARVPGAGSAIFLHVWRGPRRPTAGGVALARGDLAWILARWRPWSRRVVQLPAA